MQHNGKMHTKTHIRTKSTLAYKYSVKQYLSLSQSLPIHNIIIGN